MIRVRGRFRGGGFVLPVVILLVVMVGAVCSIMLERHVARTKTVQRQMLAYQEHHGVRSLQTVIEAWRKTPTAQPREIEQMLEPDGLAFTVEPGDGTRVEVYLFRGQGTMLTRVAGLGAADRPIAEQALRLLFAEAESREELDVMLRNAGPLAVDVNQASAAVLGSVIRAVLGGGLEANQYESRLQEALQGEQRVGLQTLSNIATEVGIESETRATLSRFLTVAPDLWRFRIDVRGSGAVGGGRLHSQYGGLVLLGGSATATSTSTFEEPTPFLSWERLNPDDPRAVE